MIFLARNRLRALIILIVAHDMQIHVAHALCKQGCRLISYTVNICLVTIAACYNCPRSPLLKTVAWVCNDAMYGRLVHGTHVPITMLPLDIRLHVAVLLHNLLIIPIFLYLNCMFIIF